MLGEHRHVPHDIKDWRRKDFLLCNIENSDCYNFSPFRFEAQGNELTLLALISNDVSSYQAFKMI
jgi:hypothetical protein